MFKPTRQEFTIKTCPTSDNAKLEKTLNSMAKQGYTLYSIHEAETSSELLYTCIFVRDIDILEDDEDFSDISSFKNQMEKLLFKSEQPYDLCLSLQGKIKEKKEKIDDIKNFLDTAKGNERTVLNDEITHEMEQLNSLKKQLKKLLAPSNMTKNLGEERLSISLSPEISSLNDYDCENNLLAQTVKIRSELTHELGYIIPKVKFVEDATLFENQFSICVHGTPIVKTEVYPDCIMFFESDLKLKKMPANSIKSTDVITNQKIIWIKKDKCKDFWANGLTAGEFVARCLKHYAVVFVNEIFNYQDMNHYIELVSENNAFLIDSILGDFISVSELKYIFCQLIREKISVKDVIYILEKINDFSDDSSKNDLLDKIRISLARQISQYYADETKTIYAYEMSEKTVKLFDNEVDTDSASIAIQIDSTKFEKFIKSLVVFAQSPKIVLLAPQHLRQVLFVLISQVYMDIPVLCYEEVANDYNLTILGEL